MIDSDQEHSNTDCARLHALDAQTLDLLVTVARNAAGNVSCSTPRWRGCVAISTVRA
jgi:hypothetical protein